MKHLPLILVCDDDATFQLAVKHCLKGKFDLRFSRNGDEALDIISREPVELVLLDVQMRTPDEGLVYLPRLKESDPDLSVVMSSGRKDFETVREAMRRGASDYVPKDFDPDHLVHTIDSVLERRRLSKRREQQNFEALAFQRSHSMIGESPAIRNLRRVLEKIRNNPSNVLITGETGTGKEVVARQLRASLADGSLAPFVAVDSSTIQGTMAESVLFGHEKGAFTGALKTTKGVFEEADGGIVYFDEIANMPLEIQAKLLRVLQEKEISRLGSAKVIELDFRVVAASNRDLEQMVSRGEFKEDLFQRLNVLPVSIPPLRERKEDVPLLLNHYLERQPGASRRFTPEAVELLLNYRWPGNVRELINLVAYVGAMTEGSEIDVADLPPKVRDLAEKSQREAPAAGSSFYEKVGAFERQFLASEYQQSGGNISQLALKLGMDRSHLYTKLREHGIHPTRRS